ncbi:acylphosphatase-2-like isoform X4 [Girardinichthys multiradiatus]|uniref:acylphosphatase-2-like isoform X4 n=1 Tax=Girardinichthys multiradiatus TaxID=208333 RepID=UPI001FAC8912|nr:acylphosphatase-2-like isoform X4 [Girardinichthys multiradiatus]XP_047221591.1 acylphosphatase-2-like isoform X4 [Girardinichthys multiradiatus]
MLLCVLIICVFNFVMSENKQISVDFEIFGNVQGVCFRMYTEDQGRSLGLSGWVKNTRQGTVIGQIQGPADRVSNMKLWLKNVGSPSSRIDQAIFSNERDISKPEIHGFSTRY